MSIDQIDHEIKKLQKKIDGLKNRRERLIAHGRELKRQETIKSLLDSGYRNVPDAAKYLGISASRLRKLISCKDVSVKGGWNVYIAPQELQDIKNGGWLSLTCDAKRSNGVKCSFLVVRDSSFCRKHHPDRHLLEYPYSERRKIKAMMDHRCIVCNDKATKSMPSGTYCTAHAERIGSTFDLISDPDFARAIHSEIDKINADLRQNTPVHA